MPDFVYNVPSVTLAIWFSVAAVATVFLGLVIVKPFFRLVIGTGPEFNASINYVTSGFSLFYGLLLGLLTVAAYQNSEDIRDSIMHEATSLGTLYAQVNTYPEPTRGDLKWMIRDYVQYTMHKEWAAHRQGLTLNGGYNRANAILSKLVSFEPKTESQKIVDAQTLQSFQDFSSARQSRLAGVITKIPDVLWYAVLVGAAINIFLIILLKVRLLQHFLLGTITAFFLGVILFVIVTLDRPLRGESGLGYEPFALLWDRTMVWDEPVN